MGDRLAELLSKYPKGFVVNASGGIDEVIAASSHFAFLSGYAVELPAEGGGFLAVKPTGEQVETHRKVANGPH